MGFSLVFNNFSLVFIDFLMILIDFKLFAEFPCIYGFIGYSMVFTDFLYSQSIFHDRVS